MSELLYVLLGIVIGGIAGFFIGRAAAKRSSTPRKKRPPKSKKAESRKSRGKDKSKGGGNGPVEIYVGNLSYDLSEEDVSKEFERYGKVISVRVITNRFNGKSKGYGFVEMADRAGADAAVNGLRGKDIKGRKLVVNEAKSQPRQDR